MSAAPVPVRPFYAGQWHDGAEEQPAVDKFTGATTTSVGCSDRAQVTAAVSAVVAGQQATDWDPVARYRALARASALLDEQRDDVARTIVADSGFTLSDARREVDRAVQTLLISGEEAKRLSGEMVPLDGAPGQRGRIGFTMHHPLGVVCAITPFNSPLNTVVHKVAPALAAGNGVIVKPASQTPRTADRLLRLLLDAGVPESLLAFVYGSGGTVGQQLLEDPRPAFYAFTGSTEVGAQLHRTVGLRRTQLEMGSLSSTIICADSNVEAATERLVPAAFRKAGQVCTSVQRLYVERAVADEVVSRITDELRGRTVGDPADPDCFVGPVISLADAERIESWVNAAVAAGARCAAGGTRSRSVVEPTVLTDVTAEADVMVREIFGPVVVLRVFDDLDAALAEVNDTPYGLAAGIFTRDINRALRAASRLRMGSVHINETSSSRVDLMPYTGAKLSGMGREGPRYAIREMSEERLITIGPL
ncbi:aldehyde dehydrogenase family protein [Dactylosporangium sp. CA-092794]|uniref:aldehyde dehydrogenase family protein n=1 Tax=Dactylosporangium sp. CA-092794 TaxID=3239929 RepID=UPI003D8DECD8